MHSNKVHEEKVRWVRHKKNELPHETAAVLLLIFHLTNHRIKLCGTPRAKQGQTYKRYTSTDLYTWTREF